MKPSEVLEQQLMAMPTEHCYAPQLHQAQACTIISVMARNGEDSKKLSKHPLTGESDGGFIGTKLSDHKQIMSEEGEG